MLSEKKIANFKEQFYLSSVHNDFLFGTYANAKRPSELAVIKNNKIEKVKLLFNGVKLLGNKELGNTIEINYKAPDGMDVQGWYITPPKFDKSKKNIPSY